MTAVAPLTWPKTTSVFLQTIPWSTPIPGRGRKSREEQMDVSLKRIGEPPHKKTGLVKEDIGLRFAHFPLRRGPFQAIFMMVSF